jgi:coenzyme Q-binding protein COQ10
LFDLVADVEKYPEFLPWILSSRIVAREGDTVWVDMELGIGPFAQHFGSRGDLDRPRSIDITSTDAPFESLHQRWQFGVDERSRTVISFSYDFSLRYPLLEMLSAPLLEQAWRTTVDAFHRRAIAIYG